MADQSFDLLVIGGGINGCGVARDAAGRGLSVLLVEKDDLAQATSSASTKLFHGGLRYLEYFKFRMVREALQERETLLRMMPHISWPLRFVLPVTPGLRYARDNSSLGRVLARIPGLAGRRPAWLTRLGLFVYDHLGGRKILPACCALDLRAHPAGAPLRDRFVKGFEYSDCWVEDSRLVVLNARSAQIHGAEIRTRTRFEGARREAGAWMAELSRADGTRETVTARAIVNAAGPWARNVLTGDMQRGNRHGLRLVRGSHIIVRRLFDHAQPYFLQLQDGRIIFAIPYERDFTLIGTTDVDHDGDAGAAACTDAERDYLLAAANSFFEEGIAKDDIVATFSGVRPLYDDGASSASSATRDYVLTCEDEDGAAALVNVFGGKITTYRRLAEQVMDRLGPYFAGMGAGWSDGEPLPGGDFGLADRQVLLSRLQQSFSFLTPEWAERLVTAYGTDAFALLEGVAARDDLGPHFGGTLHGREVDWLVAREWAVSADDILWRRSKLGLVLDHGQAGALSDYLEGKTTASKGGSVAAAE